MEGKERKNNAKFSGHYVHPRTHYARTNVKNTHTHKYADAHPIQTDTRPAQRNDNFGGQGGFPPILWAKSYFFC